MTTIKLYDAGSWVAHGFQDSLTFTVRPTILTFISVEPRCDVCPCHCDTAINKCEYHEDKNENAEYARHAIAALAVFFDHDDPSFVTHNVVSYRSRSSWSRSLRSFVSR